MLFRKITSYLSLLFVFDDELELLEQAARDIVVKIAVLPKVSFLIKFILLIS